MRGVQEIEREGERGGERDAIDSACLWERERVSERSSESVCFSEREGRGESKKCRMEIMP